MAEEEIKIEEDAAPAKKSSPKKSAPKKEVYVNRLLKKYREEVIPAMIKEHGYSSVMMVPHLEKIIINVGCGEATSNSKAIEDVCEDLATITGQHPVVTRAKKSVASFKLREGMPIGAKVTLRGERMYDFFDKLVSIALPRVRDFRGTNKNSFDGHGNYTLGVKEQLIFPEIDYDKITKVRGMDIVIVTTAKDDAASYSLLSKLGFPFKK